MKKIIFFVAVIFMGCVEPFPLNIEDKTPPLVIESFISNVSYLDRRQYPAEGRFFKTILRYGQNLNGFGENVSGATVTLLSNQNKNWLFSEIGPGNYQLIDMEFKAEIAKKYKLRIVLSSGEVIESSWESLPETENNMGVLSFVESAKFKTFREGEEVLVEEISGIELTVDIPKFEVHKKSYFMWKYDPTWIYLAGRLDSTHPFYRCWVQGNAYLSGFNVSESLTGGYVQKLAFVRIQSNERVLHELSILVNQYGISKGYYEFLNELNSQSELSDLFASPPYNLSTNYSSSSENVDVFGYFSVRSEVARRMYFSVQDLSYSVNRNQIANSCKGAIPPYGPDDPCDNCLNYNGGGKPSLVKPWWWN